MDFVFTVCDNAAGEVCPLWPGQPITAHWGIPDPAKVVGDKVDRLIAFRRAMNDLERRISLFVGLPISTLDQLTLQARLDEIGQIGTQAV